jgi:hypothetical protein
MQRLAHQADAGTTILVHGAALCAVHAWRTGEAKRSRYCEIAYASHRIYSSRSMSMVSPRVHSLRVRMGLLERTAASQFEMLGAKCRGHLLTP